MNRKEAMDLLGLSDPITIEEVKIAFRKLAIKSHPDKGGSVEAMANAIEGREILRNHLSAQNLPAIVAQFEVAIREANTMAIERRSIEKAADGAADTVRTAATGRLKNWKQIAYFAAGISAAALFFGKDIPKGLLSVYMPEELPALTVVEIPAKPDALIQLPWVDDELTSSAIENITPDQKDTYIVYLENLGSYERYKGEQKVVQLRNQAIRKDTLWLTQMFYVTTFMTAIYAGGFAWFMNRKINIVELELSELYDRINLREEYIGLLVDVFEGVPESWTKAELVESVRKSGRFNRILRSGVGDDKLSALILLKGQEAGYLAVTKGTKGSGFQDSYSLIE